MYLVRISIGYVHSTFHYHNSSVYMYRMSKQARMLWLIFCNIFSYLYHFFQETLLPAQPGDPWAIRVASVIGFSVLILCFSVLYSLSVLCLLYFSNPTAVAYCINNGQILIFRVSEWLYWSSQHVQIFEIGTTASLVAKNGTQKNNPYISHLKRYRAKIWNLN